jgi:hypothetical protein
MPNVPRSFETGEVAKGEGAPGEGEPDDATRGRAWAAGVTAAAILGFSLAWVALMWLIDHQIYGNPLSAVDVGVFRRVAEQLVAGAVPYRDFDLEYPPLALIPIWLPVLLGGDPSSAASYRAAFIVVEAAFGMLITILVMRTVTALERGRRDVILAAAMVAATPLLLGPLMLSRYDLWPALFAAAATWLLVIDRPRWAAVAVGLGVLAKVYPVVLAPFAIAYLWRTWGRREAILFGLVMAVVVLAGLAPFFLVAPEGIVDALTRAFRRPIQVESIGAAFLYLREVMTGEAVRVVHTFDSYNLRGALAEQVGTLMSVVLGTALAIALGLFVRGRPTLDRLVLAVAAALAAWVAFGRVLSPQYMIWLIAPLAVVASRRWSLSLVALVVAILLTGLYYPRFYNAYYSHREVEWVVVVLGRDLVLVALAGYLLALLRDRGPALPAGAPPGEGTGPVPA